MDIKLLLKMFSEKMTLVDISNSINYSISEIVSFGAAWGYDFNEMSRRNETIQVKLTNLDKDYLNMFLDIMDKGGMYSLNEAVKNREFAMLPLVEIITKIVEHVE